MNNEALQIVIAGSEALIALLALGGVLFAAIKARGAYQHAVTGMTERLEKIEKHQAKQTEILVELARTEERLNALDHRLEMLEDSRLIEERATKQHIAEGMALAR